MKKQLFFLLAFITSTTISAQNLAIGGTAIATSGNASLAIDDNAGTTRWESDKSDPQTWQVDLGQAKDFNTIQIVWEGAYAKTFTIEAGNDLGADGFLTGGTKVASVTDQTLSGFPYTQTLTLPNTTNARYIKFNGLARGTVYGYSFWEFRVMNVTSQTLTTFSVAPTTTLKNAATTAGVNASTKVNTPIPLTIKALDQYGMNYSTEGITYDVKGAGGTVADGMFTPTAKGISTITATLGDKTSSFSVYAYDGDNLALNKLVDKSGETNGFTAAMAVDGDNGTRWVSGTPADASVTDYNAFITLDLAAYYDIDYVDLFFENANSDTYTVQFSADGTKWTDAYSESKLGGFNGGHYGYCNNTTDNKQVRFVRFNSTKAGTVYGVSLYELQVFGSNKTEIEDTQAPVLDVAEVGTVGTDNVTLNLKATDNISSITYVITDAVNKKTYTTTGANGNAITYNIAGLTDGTSYSFSVVAKDAKGNTSEAKVVAFSTSAQLKPTVSAPTPTQDAANVKSIYSDHYTSVAPNNFFNTWGSANEALSSYQVKTGDNAEKVANFGYLGNEFNATLDMSDMDYLHFDVYPEKDMTIGVTPITQGGEKILSFDVKGNQWNSLNIPLASYTAANANMSFKYTFQIKWANGDQKTLFYLDNVYFYKDVSPDTEAPVLNTATVTPGSTTAKFTLNATDDKAAINYTITDAANKKTYTTSGVSGTDVTYTITGLTANTAYSMSVVAKDAAGNASASKAVEFTTTSSSLVATRSADSIVSISGAWDATDFANIDNKYKASCYDMTAVTSIPNGTSLNTANPNALIISAVAGKINKNEVVKKADNSGYNGYNIQFNEQFNDNATTHDICTVISPITTITPSFHRVFDRASIYFTTVLPFDVASFTDLTAYELKSSTAVNGVTTLIFNKVTSLQKGVPYLMFANTGGAHFLSNGETTINFTTSPVYFNGGSLKSTYTAITDIKSAQKIYALKNDAVAADMTLCSDSIPALRSYIQLDELNTNTLNIQLGEVNGIHNISEDAIKALFNVYSINGQIVKANTSRSSLINLPKGLYIINGKKVLIK
jgi:hypothetical protein